MRPEGCYVQGRVRGHLSSFVSLRARSRNGVLPILALEVSDGPDFGARRLPDEGVKLIGSTRSERFRCLTRTHLPESRLTIR